MNACWIRSCQRGTGAAKGLCTADYTHPPLRYAIVKARFAKIFVQIIVGVGTRLPTIKVLLKNDGLPTIPTF